MRYTSDQLKNLNKLLPGGLNRPCDQYLPNLFYRYEGSEVHEFSQENVKGVFERVEHLLTPSTFHSLIRKGKLFTGEVVENESVPCYAPGYPDQVSKEIPFLDLRFFLETRMLMMKSKTRDEWGKPRDEFLHVMNTLGCYHSRNDFIISAMQGEFYIMESAPTVRILHHPLPLFDSK